MTATRPTVVQIGPMPPTATAVLNERYTVIKLWEHADPQAALAEHGKGVRAIVTTANHGCSAAVINALPDLQAICSWGVGYEKLDIDAARAKGVLVSNTPDVLTDCVADLAWALMLATSRRICEADRYVRAGRWGGTHDGKFPLATRVSGKRLGVLGLGRIGEAIAQRGTGFGMDIRYHNRREKNSPWTFEPNLEKLAEWADYLVVACVGGAETHHLVSADVIRALGPTGVLVNIARGPVVDETALVAALTSGQLGGAGLDVFEHEPKVPEALLALDNVVLLPHVGSGTVETRGKMEELVFENLTSFFATGKVVTPV